MENEHIEPVEKTTSEIVTTVFETRHHTVDYTTQTDLFNSLDFPVSFKNEKGPQHRHVLTRFPYYFTS